MSLRRTKRHAAFLKEGLAKNFPLWPGHYVRTFGMAIYNRKLFAKLSPEKAAYFFLHAKAAPSFDGAALALRY